MLPNTLETLYQETVQSQVPQTQLDRTVSYYLLEDTLQLEQLQVFGTENLSDESLSPIGFTDALWRVISESLLAQLNGD